MNIKFIKEVISNCSEGNDSELDYCYINDEYGDDNLINEWGEDYNMGYKELFKYLIENKSLEYSEGEFKYKFELEGNLIKLNFNC